MTFEENDKTELKREVAESLKKEVIAFANTSGGIIYVGVEDDGNICGIGNFDNANQQAANMIRDGIKPDVSMFVSYEKIDVSSKVILKITVQEGTDKPYYLSAKGMRREGIFVRQGTTSAPASQELIRKMIKETDGDSFENARSLDQKLTFKEAEEEFKKRKIAFGAAQQKTLHLINKDLLYTNLALIVSDQCPHTVKAAVFQDTTQSVFTDRKEFSGSIFKQMNDLYVFIDLNNPLHSEIKGLYRNDVKSYPEEAVREAMLNMLVHRDYSYSASSFVKIYSDRIEFVSVGGLLPGIKIEDIEMGLSVCRNKNLADIFYRLKLIEAYGTGLKKIQNAYSDSPCKPQIEVTENAFKVTLPNRNYKAEIRNLSNEEIVLEYVKKKGSIKRADVQKLTNTSLSTATRLLNELVERGEIYINGSGPTTVYKIKNT